MENLSPILKNREFYRNIKRQINTEKNQHEMRKLP